MPSRSLTFERALGDPVHVRWSERAAARGVTVERMGACTGCTYPGFWHQARRQGRTT